LALFPIQLNRSRTLKVAGALAFLLIGLAGIVNRTMLGAQKDPLTWDAVFNLQGSIFKWANEGRPLIANDRAVHVVHPYNERWGVLLNPQLHWHGRGE
jgi:hypothetical protein